MSGCWWMDRWGCHSDTVVFERPWYRLFRKRYTIRCWACDYKVIEP